MASKTITPTVGGLAISKMNPRKQYKNRRSIRFQNYDYSPPGEYFITICTINRECLFGDVANGKMVLNECGKIADKYWYQKLLDGIK